MAEYRLTPKARDGLLDILDYVEEKFGLAVAERVLDQLIAAFERLASSPRLGRHREDITDNASVRFWSEAPTLIAYRVVEEVVEVLLVERGERDWKSLLEES